MKQVEEYLTQRNQEMDKQTAQLESELQNLLAQLEERKNALIQRNQQLLEQNAQLDVELRNLKTQVKSIKKRKDTYMEELLGIGQEVQRISNQIEESTKKAASSKEKISFSVAK